MPPSEGGGINPPLQRERNSRFRPDDGLVNVPGIEIIGIYEAKHETRGAGGAHRLHAGRA
jgi:hypothetical protein